MENGSRMNSYRDVVTHGLTGGDGYETGRGNNDRCRCEQEYGGRKEEKGSEMRDFKGEADSQCLLSPAGTHPSQICRRRVPVALHSASSTASTPLHR